MTDDTLVLYTSTDPKITPEPTEVVLYPADDGEGVVRLRVVTSDGVHHDLTPAPVAAPSATLRTPGLLGPVAPRLLVVDEHVAVRLDDLAPRDIINGEALEVSWRNDVARAVGWGEVAIATGPGQLGNPTLTIAALGTVTGAFLITGQVFAQVTVQGYIPAGSELWIILAAWNPPGVAMPSVLGSPYPDPLASGAIARKTTPGWKPSNFVGVAEPWDAQACTLPVAAVVLVP